MPKVTSRTATAGADGLEEAYYPLGQRPAQIVLPDSRTGSFWCDAAPGLIACAVEPRNQAAHPL